MVAASGARPRSHSWAKWWTGPLPSPTSSSSAWRSAEVIHALATPTDRTGSPVRGHRAAIAAESEQPVPWVLRVPTRGPVNRSADPSGRTRASMTSPSMRCPPFASTSTSYSAATMRAWSRASPGIVAGAVPASTANSGMLGVTRSTWRSSPRSASSASSLSSRSPEVATITGSSTTMGEGVPSRNSSSAVGASWAAIPAAASPAASAAAVLPLRSPSSQSVTSAMIGASKSMPILIASMATSSETASNCERRNSTGGTWTSRTPRVFWLTSAVTTPMP